LKGGIIIKKDKLKKIKKSLLAVTFVFVFIFCTIGQNLGAASSLTGTVNDVEWYYYILDEAEKTICITGSNLRTDSSVTNVKVPDVIDGYTVTSIGSFAFMNCKDIVRVEFPDSVTEIGNNAFIYCRNLTSVILSKNITKINDGTFFDSGLTSLNIPSGVTSIGNDAFENCCALTNITLPNTITSIGNHAFVFCNQLSSITIPQKVSNIGEEALRGCCSLEKINVSYKNKNYMISGDALIDKRDNSLLTTCNIDEDYTIPNMVTTIKKSAFYENVSLRSVTIPKNVTTIEEKAFYGCYDLETVTMEQGVTTIGDEAFAACYNLKTITIPNTLVTLGESTVSGESTQFSNEKGVFIDCDSLDTINYLGAKNEWFEFMNHVKYINPCLMEASNKNYISPGYPFNVEMFLSLDETAYNLYVCDCYGRDNEGNGIGEVSYQWYYNDTNSYVDATKIEGKTETDLEVPKEEEEGFYFCEVTLTFNNIVNKVKSNIVCAPQKVDITEFRTLLSELERDLNNPEFLSRYTTDSINEVWVNWDELNYNYEQSDIISQDVLDGYVERLKGLRDKLVEK